MIHCDRKIKIFINAPRIRCSSFVIYLLHFLIAPHKREIYGWRIFKSEIKYYTIHDYTVHKLHVQFTIDISSVLNTVYGYTISFSRRKPRNVSVKYKYFYPEQHRAYKEQEAFHRYLMWSFCSFVTSFSDYPLIILTRYFSRISHLRHSFGLSSKRTHRFVIIWQRLEDEVWYSGPKHVDAMCRINQIAGYIRCNLLKRIIQTWNWHWSKSAMIRVQSYIMNPILHQRFLMEQNYTFPFSFFCKWFFLKFAVFSNRSPFIERNASLYGRGIVGISSIDRSEIYTHKAWPYIAWLMFLHTVDDLFLAWIAWSIS